MPSTGFANRRKFKFSYLAAERRGSNVTDCNFAAVATGPFVAFMLLGNLVPGMVVLLVLNTAIFFVARKHLNKITAALPAGGQDSNHEAT
nr:hypothetical protein BaRGS_003933 [Batillaria attramentaria]